jgi:hypothetical protein
MPDLVGPVYPQQVVYAGYHRIRGQAEEARGLLGAYAPNVSPALSGHLYAIEAYADVYLADLFCSGIPLSTVDFAGDYTLAPGSTTAEVYTHAVALFDTSLTLLSDSARLQSFAQIGKGRALLALGRYAEAGAAVAAVPDDYQYQALYERAPGHPSLFLWSYVDDLSHGLSTSLTMADFEGQNGLDFVSSGDPRTAFVVKGQNQFGATQYLPAKYPETGQAPVIVADGIEARLIEAEAALQAGDVQGWLDKLNHLRQAAIAPALPDLTDPGIAAGRVDLLFRERAFWLYLSGHREGDLRRLIRDYGRNPSVVYPSGSYPGGVSRYGGDVNLPVPATERTSNPNYTGCVNRNA